ncbi:MAG TPA: 8-oxoguanine DNA glycosylase [Colwellia sp.]|nr:8-oxoguanine DNA glycosylase [Colwellia sp.]|tara:strand:- start:3727 stop:4563 length:837 start_codon:yes stop_codon:yes gene_type:complete
MNYQKAYVEVGKSVIQIDIPNEYEDVMPGVKWGSAIGFPTVAYWFYKVLSNRLENNTVQYKLGRSLIEEVGACLLGGHGIPAATGVAAFDHMKSFGTFEEKNLSEEQLYDWLSMPIDIGKKTIKYRFAKQKACYLHHAINKLNSEDAPIDSGKKLRNWLMEIKGVGPKTASWVARNWLDADDVAILDIHIYRAGLLGGFFDDNLTVERHYEKLEDTFVQLADSMHVRTSELDAVMWYEMQQSSSIKQLLESRKNKTTSIVKGWSANKRDTYSDQLALI